MDLKSNSKEETQLFGREFAKKLQGGQVFALVGEVGCGKTEFVRGVLAEIAAEIVVSSPTFSIVNSYETAKFNIYHFDFYRIKNINELFEIGFDEYFTENSVVFIEWADMFPQALPKGFETIKFEALSENEREISFNFQQQTKSPAPISPTLLPK